MDRVHQALFVGEGGKVHPGAHLREQGQKPGVLRQGGDGRGLPLPLFLNMNFLAEIFAAYLRGR